MDRGQRVEPGYAAWKRAKIERALAKRGDRAAMIPAEDIVKALLGRH